MLMLIVDIISLEMSPLLQQLISSSSAQGPASEVAETNNNFAAAASGEGGVGSAGQRSGQRSGAHRGDIPTISGALDISSCYLSPRLVCRMSNS